MEVRWQRRAEKDLRKLDPPVRDRIIDAVTSYAQTGHGDVVRLRGVEQPEWRQRVGKWRVRFRLRDDLIDVLRVLPRVKAYR